MNKSLSLVSALVLAPMLSMAQWKYPETAKVNQVDNYHGTSVADPYRWLEDDRSVETAQWVNAQNTLTFDYLEKIPYRNALKKRIEQVFNYQKLSAPSRKGEWFYFYKNNGLQNQSVLYRQKGLNGAPEVVLDPNQLSPDGTTRLQSFVISKDGKYAAYTLSKGGSDWQDGYVMDLTTKTNLSEKIEWIKVSTISWQGNGFYYSRYPKPEGSALAAKNENHQVWFHRVGTSQSDDQLVYQDLKNLQRFHYLQVTEDEKFAILIVSDRGKGKEGNALFYKKAGQEYFQPIVAEVDKFSYSVIDNIGDEFLIETNENAQNSKILRFNPANKSWKVVIPEKAEPLQGARTAGGKLFLSYLKDVTTRVYVHSMDGKLENEVKLPGLGTCSGFGGNADDKFVFYTFTSFTFPPTIYRYDIATKKSTVFTKPELSFDPSAFETKQIFYTSKDGTKVPMFITYKKGLQLNSQNPTLLYAYGGFNVSSLPAFSATLIPFLEQGGVYALANIRGGAEYGEKWHEAGMKLKKQNVFDDFIAAGEYLIAQKYCDNQHLALRGGSNGGLLVGAVINQRPDLCKVAFPQVGVMDMLRYHKFTIGWNWSPEYGNSDDATDFKNLYQYSPLHNIKSVAYPATMVTTADHDDRVVPAHSFKYTAELQAKAGAVSSNPLLIRVDVNSGHGASNTAKSIEQTADIYAFLFYNMGFVPKKL